MYVDDKIEKQTKDLLRALRSRREGLARTRDATQAAIDEIDRKIMAIEMLADPGALSEVEQAHPGSLEHPQYREPAERAMELRGPIEGSVPNRELDEYILEEFRLQDDEDGCRLADVIDALEERGWRGEKKKVYNQVHKLTRGNKLSRTDWGTYRVTH